MWVSPECVWGKCKDPGVDRVHSAGVKDRSAAPEFRGRAVDSDHKAKAPSSERPAGHPMVLLSLRLSHSRGPSIPSIAWASTILLLHAPVWPSPPSITSWIFSIPRPLLWYMEVLWRQCSHSHQRLFFFDAPCNQGPSGKAGVLLASLPPSYHCSPFPAKPLPFDIHVTWIHHLSRFCHLLIPLLRSEFPVFPCTPDSLTVCNFYIPRKDHFASLASWFCHHLVSSDLFLLSASVIHSRSCPLDHCITSKIFNANINLPNYPYPSGLIVQVFLLEKSFHLIMASMPLILPLSHCPSISS